MRARLPHDDRQAHGIDRPSRKIGASRWRSFLGAFVVGAASVVAFALLTSREESHHELTPRTPLPDAAKENAPTKKVDLEETSCWFPVPLGGEARCGVLIVPEQWGANRSPSLRLRFVVFHGEMGNSLDPVIYLNGGPGEPAQIDDVSIGRWWEWRERTDWARRRDLVVFDYRGVGMSGPDMHCPEIAAAAYRLFTEPLGQELTRDAWSSAAQHCADRLRAAGIDLASYNTEAIVTDLHSLVTKLGYRSWNILAVSYGTRVALSFVEQWPQGTEAVVLDSVYPTGINAYVDSGRAATAAFAAVFKECAEDRACHTSYPRLADTFDKVLRRAAATPVTVSLADPRDGSRIEAKLDDGKLTDVLLYAFYDWQDLDRLPWIIAALAQGNTHPLEGLAAQALNTYVSPRSSHGLFFSVECHDEFPLNRRDEVERAAAELPRFRDFILSNLPLTVCPVWPVGPVTARPPASGGANVPILMLSGALDPLTPPQWAKHTAEQMPNAVQIEFRGVGHGVLAHGCASLIVERFLNDPGRSPIDDCLLAVGRPQFQ